MQRLTGSASHHIHYGRSFTWSEWQMLHRLTPDAPAPHHWLSWDLSTCNRHQIERGSTGLEVLQCLWADWWSTSAWTSIFSAYAAIPISDTFLRLFLGKMYSERLNSIWMNLIVYFHVFATLLSSTDFLRHLLHFNYTTQTLTQFTRRFVLLPQSLSTVLETSPRWDCQLPVSVF